MFFTRKVILLTLSGCMSAAFATPQGFGFHSDISCESSMSTGSFGISNGLETETGFAKHWQTITEATLTGHMLRVHFQARLLRTFGVANYDLEMAHYRGFRMRTLSEKAYENIERPDAVIQAEIDAQPVFEEKSSEFSVSDYRTLMIKNLLLMQKLGMVEIDWLRIERVVPGARAIPLDLEKCAKDISFYTAHRAELR